MTPFGATAYDLTRDASFLEVAMDSAIMLVATHVLLAFLEPALQVLSKASSLFNISELALPICTVVGS